MAIRFKPDKRVKRIAIIILAVIVFITALFVLWWYGKLLPGWIEWKEYEGTYGDAVFTLKNRTLEVTLENEMVWSTEKDWFVQDALISDVNRDGIEELILLVWKHGSFGNHMPIWVKHNDIRLEQHIFIYKYDSKREEYIVPIWMSSSIYYKIDSIAKYGKDKILINDTNDGHKVWYWFDFGLKLAGEAKENTVSYAAVGDNLIHEWLLGYGENAEGEASYDGFYANIADIISGYDLASVNQETPFVSERSMIGDYPSFGTPQIIAKNLSNAGFDIASCATNHMLDRGQYGVETTYNAFIDNGIVPVGINTEDTDYEESVTFIDCNHINIALVAYTYGTNGKKMPENNKNAVEVFSNEERLLKQLKYARLRADVVIVYAHWGTEYSFEPDEEQKRLSRMMYDAGVDVVIGTHPHVLQDMEVLEAGKRKMLVFNSLGNFASGQNEPERLVGGIGEFNIVKSVDGKVTIDNQNIEKIIMHQSKKECAVYLLKDYTEELSKEHIVKEIPDYIEKIK